MKTACMCGNVVRGEGGSLCGEVRTGGARLDGQDYYWAELVDSIDANQGGQACRSDQI